MRCLGNRIVACWELLGYIAQQEALRGQKAKCVRCICLEEITLIPDYQWHEDKICEKEGLPWPCP